MLDIRYSCNQKDFKRYTTTETRDEFLIENLFVENQVTATYSHVDRVITLGAMPINSSVLLDDFIDSEKYLGVEYVLARREVALINIGGSGSVEVNGIQYKVDSLEAMYIAMESKNVTFSSDDSNNPAKFYMISAPAHKVLTTRVVKESEANCIELGSLETSNARTIYQYIHPSVLETCQVSLGCTKLKTGSVWNTMPSHTHERRMEVYMYFDLSDDNVVFHLMGESDETRHIVMQNEQAVISPSWSIHSGCGTSNYNFVWGMAGENRTYDDMDHIKNKDLK